MKKWIIIGACLLQAVVIGVSIKVYHSAMEPLITAEERAVQAAEKKVPLKSVEDFHVYNGQETVNVIEGKNNKGEEIIVWVPEKSKKVIVRKAKSGLTKEEAIQTFYKEKNPQKIISVRLGMEQNIPLWEIYYRSDNNLINYYYLHFETGEWLKEIENL